MKSKLPRVDLIRADNNDWLLLDNSDHITDFIKKNGFWGINESNIAKLFVSGRPNANVLDVGANIGGFTLPIAKLLSEKNGKVYSFEPQRIVFQQLCANIFINRLDNVFTFNYALGDITKSIKIPELDFWKSQNIGSFSIDENIRKKLYEDAALGKNFTNKESGSLFTVEQKTLDSFNFDFEINLIKVDIEGYELEFFNGSFETIKKNNFPPIIFELWGGRDWYAEKAEQTKNTLTNWGYQFEVFGREILAQHPKHPIKCKVSRDGKNINLSLV